MATIEEILAAVRLLPGADRGRLIPLIWDEVSPDDWACPSAPWVTETQRRRLGRCAATGSQGRGTS